MTSDLVPMDYNGLLGLAEQISRSPLMPAAYRGKPADAAIAMLYGGECGLPPMTSLQRIVVVNGKPGLDAQGMVALIRSKGHHITGEMSDTGAEVHGKRGDNGDEMSVTFTIDDAKRAGLVSTSNNYAKYPSDMLWAKAVSRIARRLFADVLMGFSYTDSEVESFAPQDDYKEPPILAQRQEALNQERGELLAALGPVSEEEQHAFDAEVFPPPRSSATVTTLRPPPNIDVTSPELIHLVEVDQGTGKIIDVDSDDLEPLPVSEDADEQMKKLSEIIDGLPLPDQRKLRANLLGRYGSAKNMSPEKLSEAIEYARTFVKPVESPLPVYEGGEPF